MKRVKEVFQWPTVLVFPATEVFLYPLDSCAVIDALVSALLEVMKVSLDRVHLIEAGSSGIWIVILRRNKINAKFPVSDHLGTQLLLATLLGSIWQEQGIALFDEKYPVVDHIPIYFQNS